MAFPEDVLTEDEHVVLHLHPHWKALIRPIVVLVLAIAAVVVGVLLLPESGGGSIALAVIGAIALVAVLWLGLWPFLVWRTTHYLFTNERVLLQQGVFSRDRRDLPLGPGQRPLDEPAFRRASARLRDAHHRVGR